MLLVIIDARFSPRQGGYVYIPLIERQRGVFDVWSRLLINILVLFFGFNFKVVVLRIQVSELSKIIWFGFVSA